MVEEGEEGGGVGAVADFRGERGSDRLLSRRGVRAGRAVLEKGGLGSSIGERLTIIDVPSTSGVLGIRRGYSAS